MAKPVDQRIDERLAALLEVERRLEAKVAEAARAAQAQVAEARALAHDGRAAAEAALARAVAEEEAADRAEQQRLLEQIHQQGERALQRLRVSDEVVERLARQVVAEVLK
jgi:hypothetical protein